MPYNEHGDWPNVQAQHEYEAYWQRRIDQEQAQRAFDKRAAESEMGWLGFYVGCIVFLIAAGALIAQALKGGAR